MNTYKVYRYIFPNGKSYVGVTKNSISERKDQGYQHNKPLQNAFREFRSAIQVEILECELSQSEAFKKEEMYIAYFKSADPEYGYNVSAGGKSTFKGLHHTEEHKQYMREKHKNKVFSESHIQHLRDAHKSERKSVIRTDENGNQTIYESQLDASKAVNGYSTNIARACKSGKPYKGSLWAYREEMVLGDSCR